MVHSGFIRLPLRHSQEGLLGGPLGTRTLALVVSYFKSVNCRVPLASPASCRILLFTQMGLRKPTHSQGARKPSYALTHHAPKVGSLFLMH